jgi:hypothetical protein
MRTRKLLVISLSSLMAVTAFGQVDYSNLSALTGGADPIGGFGPLYDSFSVGPSAATVSDVLLLLQNPAGTGASFSVNLYSDVATSPGAALAGGAIVSDTSVGAGLSIIDASFGATSLAANTRYWIGLSDLTGTGVQWAYSTDISGPGVANEFFANSSGIYPNNPDGPYQMQISSVPEPSSLAYLGLGVLPFILRRRKRA